MNRRLVQRAGPAAQLWELPDTGHVGGICAHPEGYKQRMIVFFDAACSATTRHCPDVPRLPSGCPAHTSTRRCLAAQGQHKPVTLRACETISTGQSCITASGINSDDIGSYTKNQQYDNDLCRVGNQFFHRL